MQGAKKNRGGTLETEEAGEKERGLLGKQTLSEWQVDTEENGAAKEDRTERQIFQGAEHPQLQLKWIGSGDSAAPQKTRCWVGQIFPTSL